MVSVAVAADGGCYGSRHVLLNVFLSVLEERRESVCILFLIYF